MTKGDLDKMRVLGRPIKPVALGLSLTMLVVFWVNVRDTGRVTDELLAHLLTVLAGVAFVLLVAGWVWTRQRLAETGLLLAAATLFTRSMFLYLTGGITEQAVWLTLASAITAAGAYLLEKTDDRGAA